MSAPPAAPEPRHVLFVDDEPALLSGIKKALRPFRDRWDVETAEGGRAAFAAMDRRRFDAVVTDARMPDVDGEQVLQRARERQPSAVRLVLSGQVDAKTGHRLASLAHQLLAKPSPGAAVIAAVEATCRVRDTLGEPALVEAVTSMGPPPLSPKTYHQLNVLIDNPDFRIDEVTSLVAENVSLSTMLLRLVSSPYFGLRRQVSSVQDAVTLLGVDAVREVVLLMEVFPQTDPLGVFEEVQRNSLSRSRLARLIAQGSQMTTLAAEAALLADVGVYVLAMRMPDRFGPLWTRHRREHISLRSLERDALGFTHDQVGASLLALWNLPATVVTAVASGHQLPAEGATLDASTIQALSLLIEEEALSIDSGGGADVVGRVAGRLGMAARLPELRAWASKHWVPLD